MAKETLTVNYYPKERAENGGNIQTDYDWYWYKKDQPYQQIIALLKQMDINQKNKILKFNLCARLYLNRYSANYWNNTSPNNSETFLKQKVSWNVIASGINTLHNRIAKHRPRPYFLTTEGDQKAQDKAKKLTQYIDGVFREANTYKQGGLSFRDGCIFSDGFVWIYMSETGIQTRRISPCNVYIDEIDGSSKKPTQIHFKDLVDREVLKKQYPGFDDKIDAAAKFDYNGAYQNVAEKIVVIYSYKLKSNKDAKDGCFSVSIETATLKKEEWDRNYIPLVNWAWNEPLEGYFGQSAAEELIGTQLEINKLLNRIQQAIHLVAVPRTFVPTGAQIPDTYFTNKIGAIIPYTGDKSPTTHTAQAMNGEVYNFLNQLWDRGFEQIGLSQMSATSQKPAGLDSGKALRTHHDIETERFAEHVQRYERFFLDISEIVINETERVYKNEKRSIPVKTGKKFMKRLDWKDVRLDEEKYIIANYPTSILPATPEGKLATVSDLMNAGIIDKQTGNRLLDFPDLEAELSLDFASDELIKQSLELIVTKKIYIEPDEALNPLRALVYGHKEYLKQLKYDADEDILEYLLDWIDDSRANLNKQAMSANMQAQANNQPLAKPQPQPTSELLPSAPQQPQIPA